MPDRPTIRLIAQKGSPLGTRRHVACVERRLRRGEPGAYAVGEARYLTPEALDEERASEPQTTKPRKGRLDPMQRELVGVRFLGKVR